LSKTRKFFITITIVNLIILVLFALCMLRIREMHREINAVGEEFHYTEMKRGEVMLDLGDYGVAAMKFSKNGVSITDSYLFDNKECLPKIICFVNYYATREGYDIGRSNIELIGEYRLHTILYNIGYKPNQTKTLNWDFNEDPRWYVNTASSLIGWCGL